MSLIDAHVHVWTQDFGRYPLAPGYTPQEMNPPTFTPQELFPHCRPSGVERVVLIQMSYYGFDNSYMLDVIARWPETFRGVAVLDHTRADIGEELGRVRERGVRGLRVYGRDCDPPTVFDDPAYRRLFGLAGELNMAICFLLDPGRLPAVARVAREFPGTIFVVDHLGRIGASGSVENTQVDALCALADYPNCLVKVSAFYALGQKRPPHDDLLPIIRQTHAAFGPERLMWASDCPFQVQSETYEDGLAPVRDRAGLRERDLDWILRGTAERVFFGD